MRQPKQSRAERRMMERKTVNPTVSAVSALQTRRGNRDRKALDEQIAQGVTRLQNRVKTLRYDEGAKAHSALTQTAIIADSAKLNEHAEIEESASGYLVPRQSLTNKLYLRMFKPVMEFRDEKTRSLDQASRDRLAKIHNLVRRCHPDNREAYAATLLLNFSPTFIEYSNPRMVWKSDETLLTRQKVGNATVSVKRKTAHAMTFEEETAELPRWCSVCNEPEATHTATDHRFDPVNTLTGSANVPTTQQ